MSRTIPVALQTHLDTGVTTLCGLLRIAPVNGGSVIGVTDLDVDITYDDGDGSITYSAPAGFIASNIATSSDLSVDNAEATGLLPEYELPISEADIRAGIYDYAEFTLYLVNYMDLTMGHIVLMHGTMGQMRSKDGLSFFGEMRSLTQQLRQTIVERDSLTCRATFGSQPGEVRFPCGIDATALFVSVSVDSVGEETDRTFTDAGLTQAADYFAPGMLEWLTGANAGRTYEVESFASGGIVSLGFPTAYPIAIGDTARIRPDCTKNWSGTMSCESYNNRLNFRGEPHIPVGDSGSAQIPGSGY